MEPAQLGVKVVVDKIMAELIEVKEERDFLLNGRIYKLEQDVERLATMVKGEQKKTVEIDRKVSNVEHSESSHLYFFNESLISI